MHELYIVTEILSTSTSMEDDNVDATFSSEAPLSAD